MGLVNACAHENLALKLQRSHVGERRRSDLLHIPLISAISAPVNFGWLAVGARFFGGSDVSMGDSSCSRRCDPQGFAWTKAISVGLESASHNGLGGARSRGRLVHHLRRRSILEAPLVTNRGADAPPETESTQMKPQGRSNDAVNVLPLLAHEGVMWGLVDAWSVPILEGS